MTRLIVLFSLQLLSAAGIRAQQWAYYGGDAGGSKYSRLNQINKSTVAGLRVAWTFHLAEKVDSSVAGLRRSFECTPIVIDGVMYVTTAFNRLIALDPETGRELWRFDPKLDLEKAHSHFISRGSACWTDGKSRRIFMGTSDGRLFAVDARTGAPVDSFGKAGWIDLHMGVAERYRDRMFGMSSPPSIYKNPVICGSLTADGDPHGPAGDVRAFDALTGKLVWTFHSVPRTGEFGNDTWEKDSWKDRAAANAWSIPSLDEARGVVYAPLTSPAVDPYGGDRKGANLFGDSLVALDALTGKRIWHFQIVHHDLWDYDLPAQPNLVTVTRNGRSVAAVAQVTKVGLTFLFDRYTGKPLFEIEERPVGKSEVPGEQEWPTQPRPVAPPPYARQSMQASDLTDVTPESRAYCGKLVEQSLLGDLYTPVALRSTVLFPGTNGGGNWGGAPYDPESHTLYVNSMDVGMIRKMVPREAGAIIPFRGQGMGTPDSRFWDMDRYPCQKPPWGSLTAIDMDRGVFRWRAVLGVVDALVAKGIPPTGAPNIGGSIVTAGGLVFIGATNDSRFRAFDKDTGKELWSTKLPASGHATPMTYEGAKSKKQFVAIAAGGGNAYNTTYSDSLVAFALP